jgi:hypothetical protein
MSSNIVLVKGKPRYKRILDNISSIGIAVSLFLLILWLFRYQLNLANYSIEIIIASLSIFTISRIINLDFEQSGIAIFVSFLYKLASSAFYASIILFIFGFLGLEKILADLALPIFISAIILAIIPYTIEKLERGRFSFKPKLIKKGEFEINEKVRIKLKEDSLGYEIKKGGRWYGIAILSDVLAIINTDIGDFKVNLKSPSLLLSRMLRIKNGKINKEDKNSRELITKMLNDLYKSKKFEETKVRLPFISVEEDSLGERVKVGPIEVIEEGDYEEVKIGPFIHVSETRRPRMVIYSSNAELKIKGNLVQLKENGKKLKYDGSTFIFATNGDKIKIDRKNIILRSLAFKILARKNELILSSPEFMMSIRDDLIKFYSKEKRFTIRDQKLASTLISEITEKINEQIINVFEGFSLDVTEFLDSINRVFEKYKA